MDRRRFLVSSSSLAALSACSPSAGGLLAPTSNTFGPAPRFGSRAPVLTRLEITEFSKDAQMVAALRTAVREMMAVSDPRNVRSWDYWHYSHWMPLDLHPPKPMRYVWNACRHGQSYFYAWHRGFLTYFEKMLRQVSGNPKLTLPYWDYYRYPQLPAIFAAPKLSDGSPNPLYWKNRKNNRITGLSYVPYQNSVTTFPYGPVRSFEDQVERNPHGHVHDVIGGSMGHVPTAAADPIFWLHHSNIDRLWTAWLAAGGGRKMPPSDSLWWDQTFYYNLNGDWSASVRAMNDTVNLGYRYSDVSLPKPTPGARLPQRPVTALVGSSDAAGPVELRATPITIEIPLSAHTANASSMTIALQGLRLEQPAADGGLGYRIFANVPEEPAPLTQEHLFSVGEFGSFEISVAQARGMSPMNGMASQSDGKVTLQFSFSQSRPNRLALSFVPYGNTDTFAPSTALCSIDRIVVTPR